VMRGWCLPSTASAQTAVYHRVSVNNHRFKATTSKDTSISLEDIIKKERVTQVEPTAATVYREHYRFVTEWPSGIGAGAVRSLVDVISTGAAFVRLVASIAMAVGNCKCEYVVLQQRNDPRHCGSRLCVVALIREANRLLIVYFQIRAPNPFLTNQSERGCLQSYHGNINTPCGTGMPYVAPKSPFRKCPKLLAKLSKLKSSYIRRQTE
jgi:hypothetical protein